VKVKRCDDRRGRKRVVATEDGGHWPLDRGEDERDSSVLLFSSLGPLRGLAPCTLMLLSYFARTTRKCKREQESGASDDNECGALLVCMFGKA
jgi:hypothetical protein